MILDTDEYRYTHILLRMDVEDQHVILEHLATCISKYEDKFNKYKQV